MWIRNWLIFNAAKIGAWIYTFNHCINALLFALHELLSTPITAVNLIYNYIILENSVRALCVECL